uniref:E4 n=1 Tax=Human papillomavirus TaxID=10566 RepID=A0A1Q1PPB6_9PAPI|nr:E4 [Human papillomavirus]AYA94229.1 MAG: E4 protein [Human papillomavirus]
MLPLIKMLQDLAKQENGLLNIKTVKFPLLLSPALAASVTVQPRTPSNHREPGRAPTPWDNKKKRDEEKENPLLLTRDLLERARRRATGTSIRRRLEDEYNDDDDEKENQQPNGENNVEQPPSDHLSQLLTKWGQDIDWLKQKVSEDLDNYKKRLGIPICYC